MLLLCLAMWKDGKTAMEAGESKHCKLEEEGEAAQRGGGKTASRKTSGQLACSQRMPRTEQSGEGQSAPATPPDVGMKPVEEEEEHAMKLLLNALPYKNNSESWLWFPINSEWSFPDSLLSALPTNFTGNHRIGTTVVPGISSNFGACPVCPLKPTCAAGQPPEIRNYEIQL